MPLVGYRTDDGALLTYEEIQGLSDTDLHKLFALHPSVVRLLVEEQKEPLTTEQVYVTELAGDVRQALLKRRHDYTETVSDLLWSAVGKTFHAGMSEAAREQAQAEVSVVHEVEGIEVRGRVDWHDQNEVVDFKTTSAFMGKDLYEAKLEGRLGACRPDNWNQLEMYAALLHLTGKASPKKLTLWMLYRDWMKSWTYRSRTYPKTPMQSYSIELDDIERSVDFLRASVSQWKQALLTPESMLPECDTWGIDSKTKLPKRCSSYCSVADVCDRYQARRRSAYEVAHRSAVHRRDRE